ncbi:MAG: ABC transporter permease [Nanoarchaeota archaeon]|nr:ABC transporter permease [Nanoarchaeota archaeon]MBU1704234.1 ABC transporter permease [Nanoarchaeota archaeon]
MLKDYFKLAVTSLLHRKLRAWLTMLGIFIGIAAVVSLIGLGEGLRIAITSQFGISTTEVLSIQAGGLSGAGPPGTGVVNPLTDDDVTAISRLSTVEKVIPRILESGQLEYNDKVIFGYAMSIPEGEARTFAYDTLDIAAEKGRLLKDGDTGKVVLGNNFLTDNVGLDKKVEVGNSVLIQGKKFQVIGITEKKGSFIFDNIVHMQEAELKDLFNVGNTVNVIVVQVKDPDQMEKAQADIERLLRKRRDVKVGEEDFEVQTPGAALQQLNDVLVGVSVFIAVIASISIVVGAIGITNTMFTSVTERKKQIGIMKSIGAQNKDIFYLFLFESGMLGLLGAMVGTIIGTLISFFGTLGINAWVNASAHPQINLVLIFSALAGGFLIGAASGVVPALRAARLTPVKAMR